ncbi:MAG: Gfo/Idh/MocA family oxidoreductase [Flavobacteriaceae bacterium]|nr:Gfo/Idh/MocA family oxidoreductase [Flavobacteriaceae bacterium]
MKDKHNEEESNKKITRRNALIGLAAVPLLGLFTYDYWKNKTLENAKNKIVQLDLGLTGDAPSILPNTSVGSKERTVKVGIIGVGNRGDALLKAAGFYSQDAYSELISKVNSGDKGAVKKLERFQNQSLLDIEVIGICDVYDQRAEEGIQLVSRGMQPNGKTVKNKNVKRYRKYQDLLKNTDIEAVIIATPDFHHAQMTIDAANAGKHVYCEKAMTLTEEEMHHVYAAVKKSGVVFQLGHQNSKNETFKKAKEIIKKNVLGKVTLIETTTNRNTPHGAWIRHFEKDGTLKPGDTSNIDWKQWLGATPYVPFSKERFYGWPRWFAYDTGLAGQLFSHEVDALNQIMGFGIPKSVTSSGGIYFHKEERDMPDTFQSVLEFPDRDFTMLYSASLASSRSRGRVFMGSDASMQVGSSLEITANKDSIQYKNKIKNGMIDSRSPFYTYPNEKIKVDAVSSATEQYYAERGLIDTMVQGKSMDITHLHMKEWIDVIRHGGTTGCNIEKAFQDTAAVIMVHKSYVENRKVEWDPDNKRIV